MGTGVRDSLVECLKEAREFGDLVDRLAHGVGSVCVEGVSGAGKALLCAGVLADPQATALVATYNDERAQALVGDLKAFLGDADSPAGHERVLLYPSIASALYDGVEPEREAVRDRLTVLERLCAGTPTIVVASVKSLLHLTLPSEVMVDARREVAKGQSYDRDELVGALLKLGYERVNLVDDSGQFSVRGDILDVSPPTSPKPVRIEFFGDEVERLRLFEPLTQRSTEELEAIGLGPAGELLLTDVTVRRALPTIKSAYRRELDQLNEQGKQREAIRLKERMTQDLEALERLAPAPGLIHYLPYIYSDPDSLFDYLPPDTYVLVDEPVRFQSHAEQFENDVHEAYRKGVKLGSHLRLPDTACMPFAKFVARHLVGARRKHPVVYMTTLQRDVPWAPKAEKMLVRTPPVDSFGGKLELLIGGLDEWQHEGKRVLVCCNDMDQTAGVLRQRGLSKVAEARDGLSLERGTVVVAELDISGGFAFPASDLVVLTGREIYGWRKLRRPEEPTYRRGFSLLSLRDLHEGDYVVHITHGIAIYRGLAKQTVGGMERDYLVLEYAENDKLYVPVTQLDRVQKYIGSEGGAPAVTALKSGRWEQAKKKARRSTQLLARELMKLYAAREAAGGYAFATDSPWLRELESSFRFEETPDQYQAIQDTYADMAKAEPADRLICGDVGFGKTEVAIRAAFLAVLNGKQVAFLVPTTVLAQQHYNTLRERLSRYPVEIGMLSRFKEKSEQRKIVEAIKEGRVDIVIGTHRLLISDVSFKDLGLIVIDEEQRFGVKQKERLKKLRESVDVLTLTATPIPRTLNMSLSGIRDISVINDPPQGRMPIRTYVRERDDGLIAEAIRRELERGGQVYFVHNRVKSIAHIASSVQRLVPEARVAVAHGQLAEEDLEQVMLAFYAEEFDVLVCTTIIENGLDVPNVNTIIIDDADHLGLSQLYQLRGRVGRSNRQAYAYLLYRYPDRMSEEAEQRLETIEEFSELGSGFKIALRDLEIRGAGEILGAEQSGHMSAVGLDLYSQMLGDAVKALKGEQVHDLEEAPSIDLPVEAVIPADYVPGEGQRLDLYRRLAAVRAPEELEDLVAELGDRYGEPPEPVQVLIRLARLKLEAIEARVADIGTQEGRVTVRLSEDARLTPREQRVIEGMFKPTAQMARKGARSPLPRAVFTSLQISFGYDRRDREAMFTALGLVMDTLRRRAAMRPQTAGRTDRVAV